MDNSRYGFGKVTTVKISQVLRVSSTIETFAAGRAFQASTASVAVLRAFLLIFCGHEDETNTTSMYLSLWSFDGVYVSHRAAFV